VGLVGESGCGKSVTAQSILRINPPPGRLVDGKILFFPNKDCDDGSSSENIDLAKINPKGKQIHEIRGNKISMIFQEPSGALAPIYTIGHQVMEAILIHKDVSKEEACQITINMLDRVGIPNPKQSINRYPFEFSGGMRQRALIAMALSCHPSLLIADEPTTALDMTIQAQILKLMLELQKEFGMAILFITHNLGVIAQIVDKVAVMYLGRIVEEAPVKQIFHNPKHPYTMGLLKAIPRIHSETSEQRLFTIEGRVPGPFERVQGCPFHPRCKKMIPGLCNVNVPDTTQVENKHSVACFLYE
jgi:oligopeptide/dipeptide ABC transporter ATP-binding protein